MALTDLDRNLLKRCFAQERGAWRDFVDRFIGLFIHVINHTSHARSVRMTPDDVDDLLSEVFLAILENDCALLRRFRGRSSLATYLTVISRRVVVRAIARRRISEALGHVDAHHASIEQADASITEVSRSADAEEVEELLADLNDRDARIVRSFYLDGMSYDEISRTHGIATNSIGSILSRAKAMMRQRQISS